MQPIARNHIAYGIFDVEDQQGRIATIEASGEYVTEGETNSGWWERIRHTIIESEPDITITNEMITSKLENYL
jgi:hypothetical protein